MSCLTCNCRTELLVFYPLKASLSLVCSACSDWGVLHLCFFSHTATKRPAHWSARVCKQQAPLPQSVSYEKYVRGGTCGDGCPMELATILCHIVHQFGHHQQRPQSHKQTKNTYQIHIYTQMHITLTHIHNHELPPNLSCLNL